MKKFRFENSIILMLYMLNEIKERSENSSFDLEGWKRGQILEIAKTAHYFAMEGINLSFLSEWLEDGNPVLYSKNPDAEIFNEAMRNIKEEIEKRVVRSGRIFLREEVWW